MKKNFFKSLMQAAVLLCAPLIISSCDELATEDNPIGSYISMATGDVTITLKKGVDPTFTRTAIAASTAVIEYSSEDTKVATVDAATGKVTGVGEGTTNIVAKATGYNTSGKKIYTEQEVKYKVTVKDYRARIALKDAKKSTIIVNQADNGAEYPVDLKELLEVSPAIGTDGLTITFDAAATGDDIFQSTTGGNIILKDAVGTKKITAKLTAGNIPEGYEQASFPEEQEVEFTVTVKEGIAYMAWDAEKAKAVRKTIFLKDDADKDQYTKITTAPTADLTLKAGIYYFNTDINFNKNIKIEGDVDFILKDGVTVNQTGNIQDATSDGHVINVYGQKAQTGAFNVTATGNAVVDFKTINIYGANLTAKSSAASSGAINKISAINVYNGKLTAQKTDNVGYGIKMNTDGVITIAGGDVTADAYGADADQSWGVAVGNVVLNKGKFTASSGYKAVNGTLTAGTGYKFQEKDAVADEWADITGTKSEKKFVQGIAKE